MHFCCRWGVVNAAEIDDMVGEALLILTEAARKYRTGPASFASYVHKRIHDRLFNLRRREFNYREHIKLVDARTVAPPPFPYQEN